MLEPNFKAAIQILKFPFNFVLQQSDKVWILGLCYVGHNKVHSEAWFVHYKVHPGGQLDTRFSLGVQLDKHGL